MKLIVSEQITASGEPWFESSLHAGIAADSEVWTSLCDSCREHTSSRVETTGVDTGTPQTWRTGARYGQVWRNRAALEQKCGGGRRNGRPGCRPALPVIPLFSRIRSNISKSEYLPRLNDYGRHSNPGLNQHKLTTPQRCDQVLSVLPDPRWAPLQRPR
jgi:hypothetical protein